MDNRLDARGPLTPGLPQEDAPIHATALPLLSLVVPPLLSIEHDLNLSSEHTQEMDPVAATAGHGGMDLCRMRSDEHSRRGEDVVWI